jgi:ribose transport system substrate-binding protein
MTQLRKTRAAIAALCSATMMFAIAACTSNGAGSDSNSAEISEAALKVAQEAVAGKVMSTGANGEEAASADVADLSDEEIRTIQDAKLTAALVFHYDGNDWYNAQVAGIESEAEKLGIEIISITGADFKPDKQVTNLETVLAQKPDIVLSIPTDATATAEEFKKVAESGATLVFMDQPANNLKAGEDYVSVVSADNYGNGVASAHILAESIGGEGEIAALYHDADFFVTAQRYEGFKKTIEEEYPNISIVATKGDDGTVDKAQQDAAAIIQQNANLKGFWAPWDVPAEGVMAAAREAGRTDLNISTIDLGNSMAVAMAQNQLIVGTSAQRPYDQGVTELAIAAGARVLGKTYPAYVALPALPVTRTNLADAWNTVYRADLPDDVAKLMD